jgi:hypothetical protein
MLLLTGFMSGPLYDRGYLRWLLIVGGFLVVFGYMMLSLCTTLWQCILAQGFCIGIGGGLLFVPSVAILPTYFRRRLGLAVGLAASGSSMGGMLLSLTLQTLRTNASCRSHLPHRLLQVNRQHRIWLDRARHWLHVSRDAHPAHLRDAPTHQATCGAFAHRLDCLLRRALPHLRGQHDPRLHRAVRHPLLPVVLWRRTEDHRLQSEFLLGPDSQRGECIWQDGAKRHKRHYWPAEYDWTWSVHLWDLGVCHAGRHDRGRNSDNSGVIRILLGSVYCAAASVLCCVDKGMSSA